VKFFALTKYFVSSNTWKFHIQDFFSLQSKSELCRAKNFKFSCTWCGIFFSLFLFVSSLLSEFPKVPYIFYDQSDRLLAIRT